MGKLSRYNEAIICYYNLLEINPKYEKAWINKGLALANLGKYDEAVTCYNEALEINPKKDIAWYNRACVYSIIGDKEKALSDLRRAIEFNTSNKERAKNDEDFKILWGDEEFKKLAA